VSLNVFETVPLYESELDGQRIHSTSLCESLVLSHDVRNGLSVPIRE